MMDRELLGLVIAVMSLLIGWILGRQAERISQRQYNLEARAFAAGWYSDMRAWASEAIDVLSQAIYCCAAEVKEPQRYSNTLFQCRHTLSSLIDRGRFYIPNELDGVYGMDKPPAYQGFRHPALTYLVAAEQIIGGDFLLEDTPYSSKPAALTEIKREFVSAIQTILDPRTHLEEINSLLDIARREEDSDRTKAATLLNNRYR